jgi:NAD(P)H-hydrate repair Nnr-like enzyme with NAD(P)H-hydrate dehydratase domain
VAVQKQIGEQEQDQSSPLRMPCNHALALSLVACGGAALAGPQTSSSKAMRAVLTPNRGETARLVPQQSVVRQVVAV